MRTLAIDIETYSSVDLKESGVHRYAASDDFTVLLFGYAYDDEPVQVIDLSWDGITDAILHDLTDPRVIKTAYNAAFEITCLREYTGLPLDANQWEDTMILAAACGLPRGLEATANALGLAEKKDIRGKNLIKYFSVPGKSGRHYPQDDYKRWKQYIAYNRQDVVVEREIRRLLIAYRPDDTEHRAWAMDQLINGRGVLVDRQLVRSAITMNEQVREELESELRTLTGVDNPNSLTQLKHWLGLEAGETLRKDDVAAIRLASKDPVVKRVMEIRQEIGRSSVGKYDAIERCAGKDDRVRGTFQFYGANTGRWAGRLVQLQNLSKNKDADIDLARKLVKAGDKDGLQNLFGSVGDMLSQLVRTAFVAKPGCTFAVADFSAIEARVTAWLADETWRMQAFESGKDIYCESASQMFRVPVVKHGVNGELRQKGKIAELALGYGGGVNAMVAMGADKMGLSREEMNDIVRRWREASPKICRLWRDLENTMRSAMTYRGEHFGLSHGIEMWRDRDLLNMRLPSGRVMRYWDPILIENRFGESALQYLTSKGRVDTWGGKLVENLVQATARDCLRETIFAMEDAGYPVVMHIHDEVVCEVPKDEAGTILKDMLARMAVSPTWAPGLCLRGDGYITDYYLKD